MPINRNIPREQIERAARVYNSGEDAGRALGITGGSFNRLCRQYGIETPNYRNKRKIQEARQKKAYCS